MKQVNKGGRAVHAKTTKGPPSKGDLPGWTNGLRQLYDRVVDEDLPDSFNDLLARLDDK